MSKPTRPALRYHGGKWILAPWIISHFPIHKTYVEPFGGGASVLLRKARSYAEAYNDMDGEVVNVFRVMRDEGPALIEALRMTPFAKSEFQDAYLPTDSKFEQARRTIIKSFMGFGSNAIHCPSGFRAKSNRSGTTPAHDWANYPDAAATLIERLRGVVIENKDAKLVMAQHDSADTLFYVDPPYVFETRTDTKSDYNHELSDEQHLELAVFLRGLKGMVVLSGYRSGLYDGAYADWTRIDRAAHADGARDRVESLWLNRPFNPQMTLLAA